MSYIWKSLRKFERDACSFIDSRCESSKEPGMERFNQPEKGWVNKTWKNESVRRVHIDSVDARKSKGLYMIHLCIFPQFHNTSPIYGFDVIAGKNKITGLFHDFSATVDRNHEMYEVFRANVGMLNLSKERTLPEWAQNIFSSHMVAAGNVKEEQEIDSLLYVCYKNLNYYLNIIGLYNHEADTEKNKKAHDYYCENQQKNPHTPKVMKSLGLNEEDVEMFCNHLLFPKIGEENETI